LGGCAWGKRFDRASGCSHLEIPKGLTCTHAIAYHESIYDQILSDVPDTATGVALWLRKEAAIDQYFTRLDSLKFLTKPVVASQPSILPAERRSFDTEEAARSAAAPALSMSSPLQKNFTIQAFGCNIMVIADCEQVLGILHAYLL